MPLWMCKCRCSGGDVISECGCAGGVPRTLYATFHSTLTTSPAPDVHYTLEWTSDCVWFAPCQVNTGTTLPSGSLQLLIPKSLDLSTVTAFFDGGASDCSSLAGGPNCFFTTPVATQCSPFYVRFNFATGGCLGLFNRHTDLIITA